MFKFIGRHVSGTLADLPLYILYPSLSPPHVVSVDNHVPPLFLDSTSTTVSFIYHHVSVACVSLTPSPHLGFRFVKSSQRDVLPVFDQWVRCLFQALFGLDAELILYLYSQKWCQYI